MRVGYGILTVEGFETEAVHDGEKGLQKALSGEYEMAILDVMLPKKMVLMFCANFAKRRKLPILMLTARGDDIERIVGLEIGADDYLPKPFNPRELVHGFAQFCAVCRQMRKGKKLQTSI